MSTVDELIAARDRLMSVGWCRHSYVAVDVELSPTGDHIRGYCIAGALYASTLDDYYPREQFSENRQAHEAIQNLLLQLYGCGSLSAFNDNLATAFEDVIAVIYMAIDLVNGETYVETSDC